MYFNYHLFDLIHCKELSQKGGPSILCLGVRGLLVIKLAQHGDTTLDPVLRGPACQQS